MVAVERLLDGYQHVCTGADITGVLNQLPLDDVAGLGLVVMHQPTRKQVILRPAWGRIRWCDQFRGYRGPVVMLDAIDLTPDWMGWDKRSLSMEWLRELQRLRKVGASVEEGDREYFLEMKPELLRRWLLSRTVPHEVGHWIDFRNRVIEPLGVETVAEAVDHPDYGTVIDRWWARPQREREEFADRYADTVQDRLLRHLNASTQST